MGVGGDLSGEIVLAYVVPERFVYQNTLRLALPSCVCEAAAAALNSVWMASDDTGIRGTRNRSINRMDLLQRRNAVDMHVVG